MNGLFLKILGMSVTGGIVIAATILLRAALKKAPRIFSYILWAAAFFRLLCPFAPEAPVGGITPVEFSAPISISDNEFPPEYAGSGTAALSAAPTVKVGGISAAVPVPAEENGINSDLTMVLTVIWAAGTAAMLINGVISVIRLKRRLKGAVYADGVYVSDRIKNPFIMGIIRPAVVLPDGLSDETREIIMLHEKTHIRRLDHIIKLLMYAALCVHWFNPLVWLGFRLCEKDMEMSADQLVTAGMTPEKKAEYTQTLLDVTASKPAVFSACFGENSVKQRVRNVLSYKKPALWISVISAAAVAAALVFMMTNSAVNIPVIEETPTESPAQSFAGYSINLDTGEFHFNDLLTSDSQKFTFSTTAYKLADGLYEVKTGTNAANSLDYIDPLRMFGANSRLTALKIPVITVPGNEAVSGGGSLRIELPECFEDCGHSSLVLVRYVKRGEETEKYISKYIVFDRISAGNMVEDRDRCVLCCDECGCCEIFRISLEDTLENEQSRVIRRPAVNILTY